MKKVKIDKLGIFLSYFLKLVMISLIIISIYKSHWVWLFGSILALAVSLIPTILKKNYEITLPLALDLLISIALLLHIGGGLLDGYSSIAGYDTLTHFVSSFLIAFIAFVIIYILHVYWDGLIMDKYALAFLVILFTVAMGVVWELNEWITDIIFQTSEQWGYADTLKDLFVDTLAGFVIGLIAIKMIKTGSIDKMTNDLGHQIDEKIIKKIEHRKEDKK